jgi:hypothetical protein
MSLNAPRVLVGTLLVAGVSAGLAGCGGPSASKQISLSVSSGSPGTVLTVSGKAGTRCSPGTNWFGFDFEPLRGRGAATEMTTPVQTDGSWSVSFAVPSYVGGKGAPVRPGPYELVARSCQSHIVARTTFQVTSGAPPATKADQYVGIVTTPDGQGYWLVRSGGTVSAFGDARSYGSLPTGTARAAGGIIGMARTYDARGYWLAAADGAVYDFGDARDYGSPVTAHEPLIGPVTGLAATPTGKGYWLLSAGGHVYGFGNARVEGMPGSRLAPYDAIEARPAGGYVITAADDGGVYVYPGGMLVSGGPGAAVAATQVGTAVTPSGNGAWQVGMDGGVITWGQGTPTGDASFYGSVPSQGETLQAPVVAIAGAPDGHGYWLLGATGRVYGFGDAKVFYSAS